MLALQEQTEQVARLADEELIASLQRVLAQEHGAHARLLVHIAEVDARGLYKQLEHGARMMKSRPE